MARSLGDIDKVFRDNAELEGSLRPLLDNSSRVSVFRSLRHVFALSIQFEKPSQRSRTTLPSLLYP